MSELPPRIPRAEAVGRSNVLTRMWDIEQELDRVHDDLDANQREYNELFERQHFLVSEHDARAAERAPPGASRERSAQGVPGVRD